MIISIASQKGGTGKTTTSLSLAAGLGKQGKHILLIDLDSQANSSKVLLPNYIEFPVEETVYETILKRKPLPVHETSFVNVKVSPAHILMSETDIELTMAKDHREARVKTQLDKIKDDFDHVIIDCPPALSWLTLNAFTASDGVLIVVSPGYFELDSLKQISKTLAEVRDLFNPNLELLGMLFTMSDPTINSMSTIEILRKNYSEYLLNSVIPRNTDIRDAHFTKQDIFSFNPQSKSAKAYQRLLEELKL